MTNRESRAYAVVAGLVGAGQAITPEIARHWAEDEIAAAAGNFREATARMLEQMAQLIDGIGRRTRP